MASINSVFQDIERADFVPDEHKDHAYIDAPLPIGFGQTISQPSTVRLMLEWLEPEPGNRILDVGSGSGWTSALLAGLVGSRGTVYAVERIPELVVFGRENCHRAGLKNIQFYEAGEEYGLPTHAPFDRILVSASAEELPQELLAQLTIGGKLVIPVKNTILEITKTAQTNYDTIPHAGFIFVPLV